MCPSKSFLMLCAVDSRREISSSAAHELVVAECLVAANPSASFRSDAPRVIWIT